MAATAALDETPSSADAMPSFAPGAAFRGSPGFSALTRTVAADKAACIQRLREWIALPSIAGEKRNGPQGAEYMVKLALDVGFQHAEIVDNGGQPGAWATWDVGAPRTVAIYHMFDVKQYDASEWSAPPLEGRIVEKAGYGKVMIGRGTSNTKGPQSAFLAAMRAFKTTGTKPPVNLVLVADGEEEIGSPHFGAIVRSPKILAELRKCACMFYPASSQDATGVAEIQLGFKGLLEGELTASGKAWGHGSAIDIHSSYKAQVDSPVWRLVAALRTLVKDGGNTVAIDGWFEHVGPLSPRERELLMKTAQTTSEADAKRTLGVQRWIDDLAWEPSIERLMSQPTLNIEGLRAGYMGPGGKTILPSTATAKFDCRLVPAQTFDDCVAKLKAHLAKRGYGDIEVNVTGGYGPTQTAEDALAVRAAKAVCANAGVPLALYPRAAGSTPTVYFTGPPVNLPSLMFGLGNGGRAHAPDEWYVIDSENPRIGGLEQAILGNLDMLYELAAV